MSTTWTGVKGTATPAMPDLGPKPTASSSSAMHARRELRRERARAEGRALMAADAAWGLAFPGIPSDEARAWCLLGELAAHWDRILDEAGG